MPLAAGRADHREAQMTGPARRHDRGRLSTRGAALRRRLADMAEAVADTEERLAGTFDRLARTRTRDAAELRELAARARAYAEKERQQAALYRTSLPDAPQTVQRSAGPCADR